MSTILRLTQDQHDRLRRHLLPGDGLEAAAVMLCGRAKEGSDRLLVGYRLFLIPYAECSRGADFVTWPLGKMTGLLDEAAGAKLAVVKFHSHPGGYPHFSEVDDRSDHAALSAAATWADDGEPHGSVIMLPEGRLIGRVREVSGTFAPIDRIAIVGHDIRFFDAVPAGPGQVLGAGTTALMATLSVGVVGCSGTGSIVIEQALRLGVKKLVVVDNDHVERRNLNRIVNSTAADAVNELRKTELVSRAAAAMGGQTEVRKFATRIQHREALAALAQCDVVFGCVDSAEGRQTLNRLAAFYLLPYIDLGVRIEADGDHGVRAVQGAVHYLRPDGPTLMERGVVTQPRLRAEYLARTSPEQYADELQRGYIRGVNEDRPVVISVNMLTASLAVSEMLARLHQVRLDPSDEIGSVRIDLVGGGLISEREPAGRGFGQDVGRGDCEPFLGMPSL